MKNKVFVIFLLPLFFGFYAGRAQVQTEGSPWSLESNLKTKAAFSIDFTKIPQDWEQRMLNNLGTSMKPYLFAWPVDTLINVVEAKNRIYNDESKEVYQLLLTTDFAYSINLIFDKFYLPRGAELYIFNPDYSVINGSYTYKNNKSYKQLATSPVPGNQIVVELVVHKDLIDFIPELHIGKVSFDMKNAFGEKAGHFGRSGDCNVDINCPPGANWQVEKRSVCKFIRGGSFLCSGALINNTANDGRALFLTANHCIQSGLHARLSVFYFNYESPECLGGNGSADQSISGSDLLATTSKLDFALVELTIPPPESYNPYYAGWDRSIVSFYDTVTCIHHPSGDVKKISFANRRIATGDFGSSFDKNVHWYITEWDIGTTEGGSSGSPLFNKDQRIIGDLTGGDASCSYNFNDFFQKLSVSWDKYPEQDKQLKYWLDPEQTGTMVWNGLDPFSQGKPIANFNRRPDEAKVGKYVRFLDKTSGSPTEWNWSFPGGNPSTSSDRNPLIYFESPGVKTVQLIASNELGVDSIKQSLNIGNYMDFEASQRRLVTGASTEYAFDASGNYTDHEWVINEGLMTWRTFDDEFSYQYLSPGKHDAMLSVNYPEGTVSLYHQNFIKVLPDELLFSGQALSVYDPREPIGVFTLGQNGDFPGTNSLGYDAYANAFRNQSDTSLLISGIQVEIVKFENQGQDVYLTAGLWDSNWNNVRLDSIKMDAKTIPFRTTIWFDQPIGMDSLLYGGILMPSDESIMFSTGMTLSRNEDDSNDAWGRVNGSWRPLNQAIGLNSALGIKLETSYAHNDFANEIKVETNSGSQLRINVAGLVFATFTVDLYDVAGRKIISTSTHSGRYIDVEFPKPISGVYLMHLKLDTSSFTKKILIVR